MKHLIPLLTLICVFSLTPLVTHANTSGYAWSESLGWFDFSDAVVTDTALTGHAYNDNTGWLVLDGVSNTDGTLGGYAWSESVGYFDFEGVYIENNTLKGYAYNDNTGWLSFEDGTTVTTTWAPTEEPVIRRSGRSGQRVRPPTTITPATSIPTTSLTQSGSNTLSCAGQEGITLLASNPRDLELGLEGDDVKCLQQFLNQQGFSLNTPGQIGSLGYETTYFGTLTRAALAKFQAANNITPSAGYFGPITRAFIKTLSSNN